MPDCPLSVVCASDHRRAPIEHVTGRRGPLRRTKPRRDFSSLGGEPAPSATLPTSGRGRREFFGTLGEELLGGDRRQPRQRVAQMAKDVRRVA